MSRGYRWIRKLQEETGKVSTDLLALSRDHDPFFCGTPAHEQSAQWFAAMWKQEYEGQTGIHIRRVHYRLDALHFPKPAGRNWAEGAPYSNNKVDWAFLNMSCLYARVLDLVPVTAFEDHRNDEPHPLYWTGGYQVEPNVVFRHSESSWTFPKLKIDLTNAVDWKLERPDINGFAPDDYADREYYLELWIEKTTMDDILVPLTKELGIRLVTSSGFQSITNVVQFLQRVREMDRPVRIFYISDYDKSGRQMPVGVARQIEFWRSEFAPEADIKLQPIVLTSEQIARYHLPSTPEEGKTELDALEALHPGELAKLTRHAVEPYFDESLPDRLADARQEAEQLVEDEWAELMREPEQRLKALKKSVHVVTKKYECEVAKLNQRMARELRGFQKPIAQLEEDVRERANSFKPELPQRPEQELDDVHEDDWLFASGREYLAQLRFYKR